MATIYVIYYSTYTHCHKLAERVLEGVKATGATAKLWQIQETLPEEVLAKMHAPPKAADVPVISPENLTEADGFIFVLPTRFGTFPTQFKVFFDSTGQLWQKGGLVGKFVSMAFSTAGQHGGQETTALSILPNIVHQGMIFVPLGYTTPLLFDVSEVNGGSAWGAGVIAGPDGSRQASETENKIAVHHGTHFANIVGQFVNGKAKPAAEAKPVAEAKPAAETKEEAKPAAETKEEAKEEAKEEKPLSWSKRLAAKFRGSK